MHHAKSIHSPLPNGDLVLGEVTKDEENGTYSVTLQPDMHGDHELMVAVKVGNEERPIEGSPFNINVSGSIQNEIEAVNEVIPGMENPWGVAVKYAVRRDVKEEGDGDGWEDGAGEGDAGEGGAEQDGGAREGGGGENGVVVGGDGGAKEGGGGENGVVVGGEGGAEQDGGAREGGGGENGVVVGGEGDAGEHDVIAISDIGTHRIAVIFNNDFQNPRWIGTEGDGELQFKSPRGMAFNLNGDIAVVEKENCRVQVVSVEGVFKFKFGKKGLGNGEFERPTDVVIGVDGVMYVSDSNSNRIQYFKPNGDFIGSFGKWGPLNTPYAMACDRFGRILVTEQHGNRVQCWKPNSNNLEDHSSSSESDESCKSTPGQEDFECVFKSDGLFEPVGVACHSKTNYIIITELKKQRISILDKNGQPLGQLGKHGAGDNEFTSPIGVGILGDSRVIVCDCEKKKIMIFRIVDM